MGVCQATNADAVFPNKNGILRSLPRRSNIENALIRDWGDEVGSSEQAVSVPPAWGLPDLEPVWPVPGDA